MPEPEAVMDLVYWGRQIQDLSMLHRDVELRALSLPAFSAAPILIYFWNAIKLTFFMELDLFLLIPVLIPMYLVVFIHNRLSGAKWRYWSLSKPYFAYAIRWIWRGEAPAPAGIAVRRLVILSLTLHFRSRFQLLRERLRLEDHLSAKDSDQLLSSLDNVLDRLGGRGISGWYAYVLPLASFFLSAYSAFHTGQSSIATQVVGFTFVIASFFFIVSTLIIKRGLLLGGSGRACYFPGAIIGQGVYAAEKQIFEPMGVIVQEVPFDIVTLVLTFSFQTLIQGVFSAIQNHYLRTESRSEYFIILWLTLCLQLSICGLAYFRRVKLSRL